MNPEIPPEPGTDPRVRIVRAEAQAAQQHIEAAMKRGLMWSDIKSVLIAASAVGSVFLAGYGRIEAWAQSKVDAGTQPIAKDVADLKVEVQAIKSEQREANSRMEKKFDTLFLYFRLPNPAPAPKDGGQ